MFGLNSYKLITRALCASLVISAFAPASAAPAGHPVAIPSSDLVDRGTATYWLQSFCTFAKLSITFDTLLIVHILHRHNDPILSTADTNTFSPSSFDSYFSQCRSLTSHSLFKLFLAPLSQLLNPNVNMFGLNSYKLITRALCASLVISAFAPASAAPAGHPVAIPSSDLVDRGPATYWLQDAAINKGSAHGNQASYSVWRNVKDYGAVGDGTADDGAAINKAMSDGTRCAFGCNSSTITPAIVYFPAGTYKISAPIQMPYYTQMIGDALSPPTIKGASDFSGMALIDADPYTDTGANWFTNQNNFFRQVRNFVLDMKTEMPGKFAGIHWQVAQATSLQNIVFNMGTQDDNAQSGVFMDNGSGGFMSDLTFNGGNVGAFLGSQQFTSRNLVFNNCKTAIYMNWNWGWTMHNITVNGGTAALNMSNNPSNQTVGSVVLADSTFSNVEYGIISAFSKTDNVPVSGGTLVIDNVSITGTSKALTLIDGTVLIQSGHIASWASGKEYENSSSGSVVQGTISSPTKASSLLTNGNIYARSKPQYEEYDVSAFISVKDSKYGAIGDGIHDDTSAINDALHDTANSNNILYFPSGSYLVSDTLAVQPNTRIVGILWPMILASGPKFQDASNPYPVFQIGKQGDSGTFEISDMLFGIKGPNPGAVMIEWNLKCAQQGGCGMWDTHVRMGGSYGSELFVDTCRLNAAQTVADTKCEAGFLMFHASPESSGVYLENTWFWVADHDMEDPLQTQVSIYNGRGVLIQSKGPVWMWGTASEHSMLYNYQFDGVQALFSGFMQTETPYMQPNPASTSPFTVNPSYDDPDFEICNGSDTSTNSVPCKNAWGLRVVDSKGVLIYSTGFYSFFNNYAQTCVGPDAENCQEFVIHLQNSQVDMYAVTTKAVVNMIADDSHSGYITGADNRGVYGDTVAYYYTG
nr:glucan 1,3-beta-glucosidase [Quercus suber]